MPQAPPSGGPGGAMASSGAGAATDSSRATRIANPKNPWADIQDAPHGALDQDTREMWQIRPGQSGRMGDTPPQRMQGMPKQMQAPGTPSGPPGRSKAGRDGGKGGGDSKKGGNRASPQDGSPGQKWVEVRPVEPSPAGKGGKGHQDRWEPKEMVPKAAMPVQHMVPGPAMGEGPGGGKKKTRQDSKMDDWLSQRFAGLPASGDGSSGPAGSGSPGEGDDGYDDNDGGYQDYDDEGDGRRGKKKGKGKGKGGGGRDKGKGKGKRNSGWSGGW
uniref:Uncharacterized protein n=1 Tax=Alexandrium andersonii TaxID=327968 RepID=A0A7S2NGP5_9DINO